MIRASIQLSPKTKVVDLIVLYNLYFGQISCSNVKFGALDGQSRLKSHKFGYCAPVWSVLRRPRRWGRHASRRRTSPIVLTHPSLSARSRARFRLPVPLLPRASRAPSNPSCTPLAAPVPIPATSRRRASIPRAPSRATSPRSSSVPPRARSSPTPGRIRRLRRGRH